MEEIGRCFRDTLKTSYNKFNSLNLCGQHRIKKTVVYFLGKLNRKELYNILILGNYKKPTSQGYFESFFESSTIDWKEIYLLPCKTTINTKHCSCQYKILNNVLFLNKLFWNSKKLNLHFVLFVSQQKKQLFKYLVTVYVHSIYRIKLRSSFQDILLSLMSHPKVLFLVLQAPALTTELSTDKSLVTDL